MTVCSRWFISGIILLMCMPGALADEWYGEAFPENSTHVEALLEQVDSVIIVLKDAELPSGAMEKGAPALFPGVGSLKKVFPANTDFPVPPLGKGLSVEPVSQAKRNLANMYVAVVTAEGGVGEALSQLSRSPLVEYAEPDWPLELFAAPNDEHFDPEQWSLNNTGQIHTITSGETGQGEPDADIDWLEAWESPDFPTNEIIIAVIDTGVDYMHPDMTNQMWRNTGEAGVLATNGVDDDLNGYIDDYLGIDLVNTDSDPMDDHLHGTHVAGTIAAQTDNGYGIAGICPSAKIIPIKIFDSEGRGYTSQGVPAIRYAADNGAKVINNSWGGGGYSQALQDAIEYANEKGVSVLCAAGNSGSYIPSYPASYRGAISVGATDSRDARARFSNYGPWVDVMAPGHNILSLLTSLVPNPPYGKFDSDFLIISGTSMATPTAAGAMGLLMSKYPGYEPWIYEKVMEATCDAGIYANTNNTDMAGGWMGAGRIDVDDMLAYDQTNGFLRSYVNLHLGFGRSFLAPGESTNLLIKAGSWEYPLDDVEVFVTALSSNATLNATNYSIGYLPAQMVVEIPSNTFLIGCTTNAQWNSLKKFRVQLKSGDQILETRTNSFNVYNGQVVDFCTYDLDGDGVKEVIGAYGSVVSVFDPAGNLKWFKDLGQYWNILGSPAVGDVDDDGLGEVVITAERVTFGFVNEAGLYMFEHDGNSNTNLWPLDLLGTNYYLASSFFFSTKPAGLLDADGDGDLDIAVNANHSSRARYGVFDENAVELGYELASTTNRSSSLMALGDINNDGTNEVVSAESGDLGDVEAAWFAVRDATANLLYEVRISGGTNVSFGTSIYAPVMADVDFDGEKEFVAGCTIDEQGALVAMKQDGSMLDGFPVRINNTADYEVAEVADIDGDGDLEIFLFRSDLHQILGFDHQGQRLPGYPFTDTNLPTLYANGYRPAIGDVDGDGKPELVYGGNYQADDSVDDDPYSFQVFARDIENGLMVPGFPVALEGIDGPYYPKFRIVLDSLAADEFSTNQIIMASIGSELFVINTGKPFDPNNQHWPHMNHDSRNSYHYDVFPDALAGGFSSPNRVGINAYTAQFKGFHYATNTAPVTYDWDFNGDGTNDASGVNLAEPTYGYTSPGLYTVGLTLSNTAGEVFSVTRENFITVYSDLMVDFAYSPTGTQTAPVRIDFTDLSQNAPQHWHWDFGDGHTSSNQHPQHLYTSTGTFEVVLSVSNDFATGGSSAGSATNWIHISDLQSNTTTHYLSPNGLNIFPYKTWEEAATNLADALSSLEEGHTLLVTNGVYETGGYQQLAMNDVTIRSVNGPVGTILDGGRKNPGILLSGTNSVLDGFTIRHCVGQPPALNLGGRATGRNLIVHNNERMGAFGGLIYMKDSVLTDTLVYSNKCFSSPGVFAVQSSISNCIFRYNQSTDGGIVGLSGLDCAMYNSLVVENICGDSGVELHTGGNLYNCTIAYNTINDSSGGGLMIDGYGYDDASTVHNVISYFNSNGRNVFFDWPHGDPSYEKPLWRAVIRNCCWPVSVADQQDDGQIEDEILADPQFINAAAGNYRLQPTSPCRDAGLDTMVYTGAVQNLLVDFGSSGFTPSTGHWNNVTTTNAGLKSADMVNSNGAASGLSLELLADFTGIATDGRNPDEDFWYPADASRDYCYLDDDSADHLDLLRIGGVNTNHFYDFTFYASRTGDFPYATAYYSVNAVNSALLAAGGDAPSYRQVTIPSQQFGITQAVVQITHWGGEYSPLGILEMTEWDPASEVNTQAGNLDLGDNPRVTGGQIDVGAYEYTASNRPSVEVSASPFSGTAPLEVAFATTAWDDGYVDMYFWDFGDGTTLAGPSHTEPSHTYTSGEFVATVTVIDGDGMSASNSIRIVVDPALPAPPSSFSALNVTPVRNDLAWIDQATNEASFILQRRVITNYTAIIMDDDDAGTTYESAGKYPWLRTYNASAYNNYYEVCKGYDGNEGLAPRQARYTPPLEEPGWYEIYEWHPNNDSHSTATRTELYHKNGWEYFYINQETGGGQWNLLGTWQLEPGSYIQIYPYGNDEWVVADAFKFVRVEPYEPLAALPANTEAYEDNGLKDDRTYGYRIATSNQHGLSPWVDDMTYIPSTNLLPVASIDVLTPTSGIPDLAVTALGSGTDSDGTITNYLWNFGDGYSGSIQSGPSATNASYVYRYTGLYDVTLTVFDHLGYSDTVTNIVNVYGAVPNTPVGLQARNIGDLYVDVSWTDNSFNEERFTLQRQTEGGAFSTIAVLGEAGDNFDDTNVVFDTTYGYRVRAENANGTSEWSSVASLRFGNPTNYQLPFEETFETSPTNMAGTPGGVSGQHGWTAAGDGTALVQNSTVHGGAQALSIAEASVSHSFIGNVSNVWISFWSQPVFSEAGPEPLDADAAAAFYVNTNAQVVAYNSTNATVLTGTAVSNDWNKFEIHCDYVSKVWNLELNDTQVLTNFAFYGSPASFSLLRFTEDSRDGTSYVDDIAITDSADDSDGDNLPDEWEYDHFGDLDANPGDPAANPDYTVWQCYIAGLDPTDENAAFALSNVRNILSWSAASGRVYTIYWTSNLLSGFQPLESNFTGGAFTDSTHSAEEKGFYKIKVELE